MARSGLSTVSGWTKNGDVVNTDAIVQAYVGVVPTTMTGTLTLSANSRRYQFCNPNGSDRTVTLPTGVSGLGFVFKHTGGANTLTINDASNALVTSLTTGQAATVIHDGSTWVVM